MLLKNSDASILQDDSAWLDSSIINAAMMLMKKENLHGLQDVLKPQCGGFHHDINIEQYVQIVHINSSHWITLSNVFCESSEYQAAAGCPVRPVGYWKVYDSFLSVAKKEKKLVIALLWKSRCVS